VNELRLFFLQLYYLSARIGSLFNQLLVFRHFVEDWKEVLFSEFFSFYFRIVNQVYLLNVKGRLCFFVSSYFEKNCFNVKYVYVDHWDNLRSQLRAEDHAVNWNFIGLELRRSPRVCI
jgi:hypothetical protein